MATPRTSSGAETAVAITGAIAMILVAPFWFPFDAIIRLLRGSGFGIKGAGTFIFLIALGMGVVWYRLLCDAPNVAVPVLVVLVLVCAVCGVMLSRIEKARRARPHKPGD